MATLWLYLLVDNGLGVMSMPSPGKWESWVSCAVVTLSVRYECLRFLCPSVVGGLREEIRPLALCNLIYNHYIKIRGDLEGSWEPGEG